jgi:hypothetical protein
LGTKTLSADEVCINAMSHQTELVQKPDKRNAKVGLEPFFAKGLVRYYAVMEPCG